MTVAQLAQAAQEHPFLTGASVLTAGGALLAAFWKLAGKLVERIVGAFDRLVGEVKGFSGAMVEHEVKDVERFEAIREEVRKHADIVAAPLTQVQIDIEKVRLKIEAMESRSAPQKRGRR